MNTQLRNALDPAAIEFADAPRLDVSPAEFARNAGAAKSINEWLASVDAATRVRWSLAHLPGPFALTSSFGAQAAVSLHLVAVQRPDIPVILIDTGYLFPETYQFIEQLRKQLSLNIQTFSSPQTVEDFEAQYGKLWEQGREGLDKYLELRKVEPMRRGLATLGVATWFAGLRRSQAESRAKLNPLAAIRALKADPDLQSIRTLGYVSHVDGETIAAARSAGIDQVLARSAFTERLGELLTSA